MAYEIYKTYLIASFAKRNPTDKTWTPSVAVSWTEQDNEVFHELKSDERFPEDMLAEQYGIYLAKAWIDQQVKI